MVVSNFALQIHFKTEVALGRWLCLDALLDASLELQGVPEAERRLPLCAWTGTDIINPTDVDLNAVRGGSAVWMGSAAIVEDFVQRHRGMIGSLNRLNFKERLQLRKTPKSPKLMNEIDTARDLTAAMLDNRRLIGTPYIEWHGRGDMDQVRDLIEYLPGIGAKTSHGYGRFSDVKMIPVSDHDLPLAGIIDKAKKLLRPVPAEMFSKTGCNQGRTAMETTAPPYYRRDMAVCAVVPISEHAEGVFTR